MGTSRVELWSGEKQPILADSEVKPPACQLLGCGREREASRLTRDLAVVVAARVGVRRATLEFQLGEACGHQCEFPGVAMQSSVDRAV